MPDSLMSFLCRLYGAMLYAYPRGFRMEYGALMQQAFRDRCRDAARKGPANIVRFTLHSAIDWISSVWRECSFTTFALQQVRAVWSAGRNQSPRGFVGEWAVTILLYLFCATTLVQAYVVPTGSMESTVRVGDHMLVDRLAFANSSHADRRLLPYHALERGDIVCFRYPEDIQQTYVKRVIGMPGDRIRMVNKQVIRNGKLLLEPYTRHIDPAVEPFRDNFPDGPAYSVLPLGREMLRDHMVNGEVVVPPDTFFAMGDNRDNSSDSRFWGFVPMANVVGKPLIIYWSFDAPTEDLENWSVDHVFDVALHFFTKTRWERTFLVPRSQKAREVPYTP